MGHRFGHARCDAHRIHPLRRVRRHRRAHLIGEDGAERAEVDGGIALHRTDKVVELQEAQLAGGAWILRRAMPEGQGHRDRDDENGGEPRPADAETAAKSVGGGRPRRRTPDDEAQRPHAEDRHDQPVLPRQRGQGEKADRQDRQKAGVRTRLDPRAPPPTGPRKAPTAVLANSMSFQTMPWSSSMSGGGADQEGHDRASPSRPVCRTATPRGASPPNARLATAVT